MRTFFKKIKVNLEKYSNELLFFQIKYNLISDEELRRTINCYDWEIRETIAFKGKCLDILVHDEDSDVRYMVALQGYGLNILKDDENFIVKDLVEKLLKNRGEL